MKAQAAPEGLFWITPVMVLGGEVFWLVCQKGWLSRIIKPGEVVTLPSGTSIEWLSYRGRQAETPKGGVKKCLNVRLALSS